MNLLFEKKGIVNKIIIALVFILMFNFVVGNYEGIQVFAEEQDSDTGEEISDEDMEEEGGGALLLPIHSLILFLADSALQLMQNSFISSDPVIIKACSSEVAEINGWAIAGIVIGVIVLAVACVVTYGAAAAGATAISGAVAGTSGAAAIGTAAAAVGSAASTYGGTVVGGIIFAVGSTAAIAYSTDKFIDDIKGEFDLPIIQYSPEAIFSNRIPLFNINFFNPVKDNKEIKTITTKEITTLSGKRIVNDGVMPLIDENTKYYDKATKTYDWDTIYDDYVQYNSEISQCFTNWYNALSSIEKTGEVTNVLSMMGDSTSVTSPSSVFSENISILYTKQDINGLNKAINACNEGYKSITSTINTIELDILSDKDKQNIADKISTMDTKIETIQTEETTAIYKSSSKILQKTVASMYKTLRTVAIVALLSILVYVGIRMVISSTSKDKAKYKQMLLDWLVAFIMVFVLHYIMAFIIDISENLTKICSKSNIENVLIPIPNGTKIQDSETGNLERLDEGDDKKDLWATNFMGSIRFYAGLVQKKGYTLKGISYTLMYIVLVIYVGIFTFQYMKRVLWMAFLTMIAPLVAITYPIDKINDGKAQGFSLWIREYIFNALLQPIHYIIYVIIVGSAMKLIINYPVYALVALGFMTSAEKFIRKMFGFEKAGTVGALGGAAGAALLMNGVQRLTHRPKQHNDENNAKGEIEQKNGKVKTINSLPEQKEKTPVIGGNDGQDGSFNLENNNMSNSDTYTYTVGNERDKYITNQTNIGENDKELSDTLTNYYTFTNPEGRDTFTNPEGRDTFTNPEGRYIFDNIVEENQTKIPTTTVQTPKVAVPTTDVSARDISIKGPTTLGKKDKIKQGFSSIGNGFAAVGGHYTRRLENSLRNGHPLRAIRRGATFAIGAATLGTIGLAAGIASGDPSKALQYTMAGGLAGGNLGKNLGETASNVVGIEGAVKSFKAGALGEKNDEIERKEYKRKFKRNTKNYDEAVKHLGVKGAKELFKDNGVMENALDYGIYNIDDMCNIYKAKEEFKDKEKNITDEEAMTKAFEGYKLNEQFGDYHTNSKTQENLDKLLDKLGYEGEEKQQIKEGILDKMDTYQMTTLGSDKKEDNMKRADAVNASINYEKEKRENEKRKVELKEMKDNEKKRKKEAKKVKHREKDQESKARKQKLKEKNNVKNGEQGQQVNDKEEKDEGNPIKDNLNKPPRGVDTTLL